MNENEVTLTFVAVEVFGDYATKKQRCICCVGDDSSAVCQKLPCGAIKKRKDGRNVIFKIKEQK